MQQNKDNCSPARKMAVGGVFAGLSFVILYGGSFLQIATFAAPAMAGLCLIPLAHETGAKTALLSYTAVSLMALFLCYDKELALFYLLLFGYYPIIYPKIQRFRSRFVRIAFKVLLMCVCTTLVYLILIFVLTSTQVREEFSGSPSPLFALILALGGVTFLVYDNLVLRLRVAYVCHFRKKIFRCK